MPKQTIRGIDHIGVFVSDIEEGKTFFIEAFGAQLIYQSLDPMRDTTDARPHTAFHSAIIEVGIGFGIAETDSAKLLGSA